VERAFNNKPNPPKRSGRNGASDSESGVAIMNGIGRTTEKGNRSTRMDILPHCTAQHGEVITRDWMNCFILWNRDQIFKRQSIPQEDARLQVSRIFRDETIPSMTEIIPDCVLELELELVLNLDQVSISE
jgi:hypothetical protein